MGNWREKMSSTSFPINDLLRRRLQTGLTVATLTLSVASTLFLLLFGSRISVGISSATGTLTLGLNAVYSQFILFIGALVFIVGAVLTSFIVFLMMAQRTRDFGLIKAAGCPNSLVAGYFITELLAITAIGCVLGVALGILTDFAASNIVFKAYQTPNLWFAPLVFAVFFVLALFFGVKPISTAANMSPVKALSPINYYHPTAEVKHKPLSRRGITWRIAQRSFFRRQSASVRIIVLLSVVFVLLTVSIAGGIIARDTTTAWISGAVDKNALVIAHSSMGAQYMQLISAFSGAKPDANFTYLDPKLAVPENIAQQLSSVPGVALVDERLVAKMHVFEVANFTIEDQTTYPVGDKREGDPLVIGVNPEKMDVSSSLKGRNLSNDFEATVGDSVAHLMYSPTGMKIQRSDPLVEGIRIQNTTFNIVGVSVDPTNNGLVTYVTLKTLENITGFGGFNVVLVHLDNSVNRNTLISQLKSMVKSVDSDLDVFSIQDKVSQNIAFLGSTWSTILLLPTFSLISAALCLVGYMMLAADEQRQELGILRAVGAKPKLILSVMSIQALIVLLSSFAVGLTFGTIITVLILMQNPIISAFTVLEIAAWFFASIAVMFIFCLIPAFRLAKSSILRIMA
jgi:ABC-type antimicrobial peptide transport system permease subunit